MTDTVVDYGLECICDSWITEEGIKSFVPNVLTGPVEGFDTSCKFHSKYPDVFFDRDEWWDKNYVWSEDGLTSSFRQWQG